MTASEREYMHQRPIEPDPIGEPEALGCEIKTKGTRYEQQLQAEKVLKFACPTQDANGKWYRCTLAVSNVPVSELFNVISNVRLIGARIREYATVGTDSRSQEILRLATKLTEIAELLKTRDHAGSVASAELIDPNLNAHPVKTESLL